MRRVAFGVGLLLVVVAGVLWGLSPDDPVRLGFFAGAATAVVTLAMLWSRRDMVPDMDMRAARVWMHFNLVSRLAVLVLVLLLLRQRLGASGDMSFLGGFFVTEAAVLIFLAKEKG